MFARMRKPMEPAALAGMLIVVLLGGAVVVAGFLSLTGVLPRWIGSVATPLVHVMLAGLAMFGFMQWLKGSKAQRMRELRAYGELLLVLALIFSPVFAIIGLLTLVGVLPV